LFALSAQFGTKSTGDQSGTAAAGDMAGGLAVGERLGRPACRSWWLL